MVRLRWRGDHEEVHPELGRLVPGAIVEVDATRAEDLVADPAGAFEVVDEIAAAEPAEEEG